MGVSAVIDKDYASSLLAQKIGADLLLISSSIEKVALNFRKPNQQWIDRMTLSEAKQYQAESTHFLKGSMAPKIQAVIWFLEEGGKQAIITNPENIGRGLRGETVAEDGSADSIFCTSAADSSGGCLRSLRSAPSARLARPSPTMRANAQIRFAILVVIAPPFLPD